MKKEIILIVLAVSAATAYYFFSNMYEPIKNFPPKNDIIVAFGDSLVAGYGSTNGNDFVSDLSKKIGRPIINLGVPGDTTDDGLTRINDVLARNPGTVILEFGGNDFLRDFPTDKTFANLRQMITILQSNGTMVVLLGIRGGVLTDTFRPLFDNLAKTTGVVYVPDILDGLIGNAQYMFDEVHPNDLGYAKIAEKIYDTAGAYLKI